MGFRVFRVCILCRSFQCFDSQCNLKAYQKLHATSLDDGTAERLSAIPDRIICYIIQMRSPSESRGNQICVQRDRTFCQRRKLWKVALVSVMQVGEKHTSFYFTCSSRVENQNLKVERHQVVYCLTMKIRELRDNNWMRWASSAVCEIGKLSSASR